MMMDYDYLQQRLQLRVDLLEKRLVGVSELILAPKASDLSRVRVHCRQMKVARVTVNGLDARFEQLDFLSEVVHESYRDWASYDLFYRGAIVASKEGTLVIELPAPIERTNGQAPSASQASSADDNDNSNVTDDDSKHAKDNAFWDLDTIPSSQTGYEPLRIRVEYVLEDPRGGVRFLLPDADHPNRSPHMYTYCGPFGGLCDGARMWMPCRDSLKDTCTFRIELLVPAYCVAICSGRLVDQSLDESYRSFRYVVNTKTNCSMLGFAVGPFRMYIPEAMPRMTYFCLPEVYEDLVHTTSSVHLSKSNKESTAHQPYPTTSILAFYEGYLNARYPFETYQQVYVEDPPDEVQYYAGASVLDQRSLYGPTIIDRKLPSHLLQVKAFVGSWIAGAIGIQTTKDAWVLIGVVGHLVNAYVKVVFGEEEYGYRIQLAMDALTTIELTSDDAPTLIYPDVDVYGEYDPSYVPFLEAKGPLILHMIEQRVGQKHLQISLQRIVAGSVPTESYGKQPSSGNSGKTKHDDDEKDKENDDDGDDGDDGNTSVINSNLDETATKAGQPQALSTWSLLSIVKSIAGASGQDLCRLFLQTWIVHGGLPFFSVGFWYNRKQTQAEVVLEQTLLPGCEKYTGNIKITIVEEQSEYVHHKRIESLRHKWEFPCHSKVRKKRRTRQKLDQSDDDYSSQISGAGMGLNDTPVYWVKIDPECGWLRHIVMYQPDFNWMEQLLSDSKCVRSRVHAARALALYPLAHEKSHVMACRVLTECMHGLTTHSRRLRAEAAIALGLWQSLHAPMTNARTDLPDWKGMHNLVRIFKEHFFDRTADMPLPNYFLPSGGKVILESVGEEQSTTSRDIQIQDYAEGEYEIKKAIPKALAVVRSRTGFSPPEIETFLLQLLMQNDNSKNYVEMADESSVADDCFYVGSLILALSVLVLENRSLGKKETATEILRLLHYDDVRPSYGHTITICCLEALCNLQLTGRLADESAVPYHRYASPKYPAMVRKAAIESILRLYFAEDPRDEAASKKTRPFGPVAAISYALRLVETESSPSIRRFAIQVCLNCLRGFPPSVAAQVLATWDHAYTLGIMHAIQMEHHGAFLQKSPTKESIASTFTPPSLLSLREDSLATRAAAELLWSIMNTTASTDQPLRVSLALLYRKIWGDATPICLAHSVQEKPANWAGGYESLRKLIEESKSNTKSSSSSGHPTKSKHHGDDHSKKRPPSGSPPLPGMAGPFDQLKGKKLKLKLGETVVMSHKL